ncbi:MAG TPA: peptidylprolyl isomerase [Vicinamibacterales bacterium]|nr:peptidylprolyl isomerase [Vicinamibacterales bacterium]
MIPVRALAGIVTLVAAASVAGESRGASTQNVAAKADPSPMFTCGTDQIMMEAIPFTAPNVILAGDGRFYIPCFMPEGIHEMKGMDGMYQHRERRELFLIENALLATDPELRWRAAQAWARNPLLRSEVGLPKIGSGSGVGDLPVGLGGLSSSTAAACRVEVQVFSTADGVKRWQPGMLFHLLRDPPRTIPSKIIGLPSSKIGNDPRVQREGAYAVGLRASRVGLEADILTAVSRELQACFRIFNGQQAWDIAGLILEDIGLARYERDAQVTEAESFLVNEAHGPHLPILIGATRGFEALYRQHGQYPIREQALMLLRQLARYGSQMESKDALVSDATVRRLALMALQAARDQDTATLRAASIDSDWQVRRLVAGSLNLLDAEQARLGEILAKDDAFQVRYEMLGSISRLVRETRQCAPVAKYLTDVSPAVVMRAMDSLVDSCTDLDEPIATLIDLTDLLSKPDAVYDWHIVSRALAALARLRPEAAAKPLAAARRHDVWQMRATAAAAAVDVKDDALALALAKDAVPNVQTAALDALFRLRSAEVVPAAIKVLAGSEDYQAVRMAAMALKGLKAESKEEASDALISALRRLTAHESDTSRESRIAIIDRLAETLDPGRSHVLVPFAIDFDDEVNGAVAKTLAALGARPPGTSSLKRRYPYQPQPGVLEALPTTAAIILEEGTVTLRLLTDVAPVTVARFAELVNRRYYDGLTFHRVVPNFFAQAGSPGANDYSGVSRFMRDEVGPQGVHVRGAVGMLTRGGDTGNGQFFIDLIDLPIFDHEYTVFAYVTGGMPLVDKLLEGAVIKGVSIR